MRGCDFYRYNYVPRENHHQECTEVPRATENQNSAHSAIFTNYIPLSVGSAFAVILANTPFLHIPETIIGSFTKRKLSLISLSPLKTTILGENGELVFNGYSFRLAR